MWTISKALMKQLSSTNSHSSQELVAESSVDSYLTGEQPVQLSSKRTRGKSSSTGKTKDTSNHFPFGTTYARLTESLGEELLMSYREGFLVSKKELSFSLQKDGDLLNRFLLETLCSHTKVGGERSQQLCNETMHPSQKSEDLESSTLTQPLNIRTLYQWGKEANQSSHQLEMSEKDIIPQWSFLMRHTTKHNTLKTGGGLSEDTLLMGGLLKTPDESQYPAMTKSQKSLSEDLQTSDLNLTNKFITDIVNTISQRVISAMKSNSSEHQQEISISQSSLMNYMVTTQKLCTRDSSQAEETTTGSIGTQCPQDCAWILGCSLQELERAYLESQKSDTQTAKVNMCVLFINPLWQERVKVHSTQTDISIKKSEVLNKQMNEQEFITYLLMKMRATLQTELLSITAKTSQSQEKALVLMENAQGFGLSLQESSKKLNLHLYLSKTPQCSEQEGSTKSSPTLTKQGTMRRGLCSELTTLELHTEESECGCLEYEETFLTPMCSDARRSLMKAESLKKRWMKHPKGNLAEQIAMFPTPTVHGNYNRKGASKNSGDGLATYVKKLSENVMFPTPRTKGLCGGSGSFKMMQELKELGVVTEEERKTMTAGNGGALSPDWTEWLMGWPIGWTDLQPLETDRFQLWLQLHSEPYLKL